MTNRDASKQSEPASKPSEVDSETKKDSGVSEASLGKDEKVASSSSEKEGNSSIEQPKNDLASVPSENISSGRASFRSVTASSEKREFLEQLMTSLKALSILQMWIQMLVLSMCM